MQNGFLQLNIDTNKTILSSKSHFYKTENFCKKTKYVSNIDRLLTKVAETILKNSDKLSIDSSVKNYSNNAFRIQTNDNIFSFIIKLGSQVHEDLNKFDIIFVDYVTKNNQPLNLKVDEYVKNNSNISIIVTPQKITTEDKDFSKLYLISNVSGVNLPKLTHAQKEIVETVDKNILVQGVAGSGKTNICIDKIIYTACKNYSGKVLYSTFSRGLLIDTKLKIELFKQDLQDLLLSYKSGNVVFLDKDHKKALENRLGIYFFADDDDQIFAKIEKIIDYLTNKVDYFLIEDLYKQKYGESIFVGQDYFINKYSKNLENYQIEKCFSKLSKYSKEIIYKEIFGMILGFYTLEEKQEILSLERYITLRQNSIAKTDCEIIYQIALDFVKHCKKNNLMDNNLASKLLIKDCNFETNNFEYSLSIIDEVQDYTQCNLCLFKVLSLKLFCVGDALQMINPSYFNFGYLKNLLYQKDVTDVKELQFNYRNSIKIAKVINELSLINKQEFGTHNFVIKGKSVDNGVSSRVVFVTGVDFLKLIVTSNFDNFTFIVSNDHDKKSLMKIIKNQEILTVSEVKGLERDTVVLFNILSSNKDKWQSLERIKVNHKEADENSVYRYYYNLFYVGLSRAKQNIFVVEDYKINQFEDFFKANFESLDSKTAIKVLNGIISKAEFSQQEILERVKEFLKLEQFDNARFNAGKIKDDAERINSLRKIEVYENFVSLGKYREAGIKFWEYGLIEDAKQQFVLSGDTILINLIDRCSKQNSHDLNIDIVDYFLDMKDNQVAQQFIIETIKKDVETLKSSFNSIKDNLKKKGNKRGK